MIILGVGSWLYKRSLSPFFPTNGPQFAYACIEKVNEEIEIVQPNEFYSSKHLYALVSQYFEGIPHNRMITFKQFKLLGVNLPRIFLARIHKKQQDEKIEKGLTNISREELYTFVIQNARDIAVRHKSQLVVLWMPYRSSDTVEQEMVLAVNQIQGCCSG